MGYVENSAGTLTTTALLREMEKNTGVPTRGMSHPGNVGHQRAQRVSRAWRGGE
ncbi:hypothetical protein HZB03_04040 [Candidatus Woesearchaeota archaeon]|nr:hypothetical protein [Candidatus Woesearchaeota archaeon]